MPASIRLGLAAVLTVALGGCLEPNPAYQLAPDPTAAGDEHQADLQPGAPDGGGGFPRMIEDADALPDTPLLVLSELMANPAAVPDSVGEWIELFNPGHKPVDINGWTLKDKHKDMHVIAADGPLWVRPKGYVVLGRSTDQLDNGGLYVAYAYRNFYLSNSADEIILLDNTGAVAVNVSYSQTTGWSIPEGASLSVKQHADDGDQDQDLCTEVAPWPGSHGDAGTPGFAPGC